MGSYQRQQCLCVTEAALEHSLLPPAREIAARNCELRATSWTNRLMELQQPSPPSRPS